MSAKTTRVNIQIPNDLLTVIDRKADELYLSRSAYIVSTLAQYLNGLNAISAMSELSGVMKQALDAEGKQKDNSSSFQKLK